ncbi:hypothetical protein BJF91_11895 [Allorhizobium taibaishanense]|uniref:Uncharacterized protein n=1 Tax=Allorhizobium taibaishanense TaxID=887144 RepID=A0A1Q9A646_9HYPH|nr:hypothetical protein [Allorhizobium taibaishanense]OLP50042.1 hypothetical protein BJF91_11895 [Allorhizobium taibaishanense]
MAALFSFRYLDMKRRGMRQAFKRNLYLLLGISEPAIMNLAARERLTPDGNTQRNRVLHIFNLNDYKKSLPIDIVIPF